MKGTLVVVAGWVFLVFAACAETPAQPRDTTLSTGVWTGDGCLSVSARDGCDFVVGCGHGHFPVPLVGTDGTFQVDGTYRIEAGPISIDPAPPAKFTGVVSGQTLTLTVAQRDGLRSVSYVLQLTSASGGCRTSCV
jgi:hypothetical protein